MRKVLCLIFLLAWGSLYAQEDSILKYLFTDPVNEADTLMYDEVTSLKQVEDTYHLLFPFSGNDFYNCYDSLEVSKFDWLKDSLVSIDVNYKAKRAKGYAYFKPATSDINTAIFIVPGSGLNQSGEIYRNTNNFHNQPVPVSEVYRDQGDVFIYIKPNEDILSIHNNGMKLNAYAIYPHLLLSGRPYSANYLIQCLAFIKTLKAKYDRVMVMGLSQGGYASFLLSLISEPTSSIVASGYSILLEEVYYANVNQIIIDDLFSTFRKESIRNMISEKSTYYLFSWGVNEQDYYNVENQELLTYNYFKDTKKVSYYNKHSGHLFPPYDVVNGFMQLNNARPLVSFKSVSDCEKLEELVIVEGKGDLPVQFQVQFENESPKPFSLNQRVDTLRNLRDGKYTFSNPENAAHTSVLKTELVIRNPKALSEATLQAGDFTYERSENSWVYNKVVDTVLVTGLTFTDAASNSFDFHPAQAIRLSSGTYQRFVAKTRGNCMIEKDINVTLKKPYISFYPNPGTGHFLLEVNFNLLAPLSIEICDSVGNQLAAYDVSLNVFDIDLSGYDPGVYQLRVYDRQNQIEFRSFKIVKN